MDFINDIPPFSPVSEPAASQTVASQAIASCAEHTRYILVGPEGESIRCFQTYEAAAVELESNEKYRPMKAWSIVKLTG